MSVEKRVGRIGSHASIEAPIRLWALHGFVWFAFSLYCWAAWIVGPDFTPNTIGREDAPQWYVTWVRCVEAISAVGTLVILHQFVLKPVLKTGRLSFDGIFVLSCWMLYIQEPWINYTQHQFLYTTVAFNFGSWCRYVPGWNSPHPELIPVGTFLWCTAYLTLVAMPAVAGSRFMTWLRSRHPGMSLAKVLGATLLAFVVFDFLLESLILRTGLFSYSTTVPWLTLWAGEPYQFPLYEVVSWCAVYTGLAAIHHFRDDKGFAFAERGVDQLRVPEVARTWLRFLATMGLCQLVLLFAYMIPYQFWSMQGGPYPEYARYRTAGLCGPDTAFDCPGPNVLVPRAGAATNRTTPVDP